MAAKTKGCKVKQSKWASMSDDERKQITDARDAKLTAAHEQIQGEVAALLASGDFDAKLKAFFDFHSRFHTYSFQNSLWLMVQSRMREDASSRFASYGNWQKAGRQVRKGETGYGVLAPLVVKDKESEKAGERPVRMKVVGFKVGTTFSKAQTDPIPGKEKPEPTLIDALEGDGDLRIREAMEQYAHSEGLSIVYGDDGGDHHGYYQAGTKKIYVKEQGGMQMLKTLCHEIAHDHDPALAETGRIEKEAVAEGAAYIACRHFGFDTGSYSFAYIAAWVTQGDDPEKLLKRVMDRTVKIAKRIIDGTESVLDLEAENAEEQELELA